MDPVTPVAAVPAGPATPAAPGSRPVTPAPAPAAQPTPAAAVPAGVPAAPAVPAQTVPIATLLEERGKRQALEAELSALRNQTQAPQPPIQQQPNVNQELERLWETDPRRAVQAELMMAINWYDQTNAQLDFQADQLTTKYADFNNWRTQAMRYVRGLPTQQRAQPGVLEMAYYIVRGQNVDDILKQQNDDLMRRFQSGELAASVSPQGGMSPSQPAQRGIQLTAEQMRAADAMGVPHEEYVKYVKIPTPAGG